MQFSADIESLTNAQEYFVTVVAFRGNKRSEITEIWKAVPNIAGLYSPAVRVDLATLPVVSQFPAEHDQAGEEAVSSSPAATQVVAAEENIQSRQPDAVAICAGCTGDVMLDSNLHLYVCRSCAAQYVQRAIDGKFLAVSILANGVCACCDPRRPLIKPPSEPYKRCSLSGEQYVDLPGNGPVRVCSLDYGLCSCCNPTTPLVLNMQGQIVCSHKHENLYVREGNLFVLRIPDAPPSLLNDIDAALAQGSAGMLPNGILTTGDGQPRRRPRARQ